MMRRRDALLLGMMAAVAPPWPAFAQEPYPSRPIRLVIPSVPAGVHDVIGRLWAERVKPILGTIVIDNRGGGGGVIGANDVAHSKPDGYSILLGSTSTQVLLAGRDGTATLRSDEELCRRVGILVQLDVHRRSIRPCRCIRLKELIAYAKANPGKLSLWLGRQRFDHQHGGRAVQAARRRARHRAHPLQGHRPGRRPI